MSQQRPYADNRFGASFSPSRSSHTRCPPESATGFCHSCMERLGLQTGSFSYTFREFLLVRIPYWEASLHLLEKGKELKNSLRYFFIQETVVYLTWSGNFARYSNIKMNMNKFLSLKSSLSIPKRQSAVKGEP